MSTAAISSRNFDDAVIRGTVKETFEAKRKSQKPYWKNMGFEEDTTEDPYDEYSQKTGIGLAPRKEEGAQIAIDVPKQGYTIRVTQVAYAIMVPVTEEALRFMKKGKMNPKNFYKPSADVAVSLNQTQEVLASDVLGNAFDTNFTGADGQPLVSTSHKLIKGGTASNHLGAVAFSQSSLEAAFIQADRFTDDNGLPIGVQQGKTKLVLPPEYKFEAKRILKSIQQSDTANNAINALKDEDIEDTYNPYLPSTSNWFKINTGEEQGLFATFETKPQMKDFGDDKVGVMYFKGYMMCVFAFGLNFRRTQGANF